MPKTEIAVIGAGHAGVEAALAAARMGVDTVLFTVSLDAIANMPCNPSIGGVAKGHLVYEIVNRSKKTEQERRTYTSI